VWRQYKPKSKTKVGSTPTSRWCLRFDLVEVETRCISPLYCSLSSLSFRPLFLFLCGKNWSVLFEFSITLATFLCAVCFIFRRWVRWYCSCWWKSEFFMLITSVALHSLAIAVIPPFLRLKCPGVRLSIQPRTVQYQVGQTLANVPWAGQSKLINDQFIKFTISMIFRHQFNRSTNQWINTQSNNYIWRQ